MGKTPAQGGCLENPRAEGPGGCRPGVSDLDTMGRQAGRQARLGEGREDAGLQTETWAAVCAP